MADSMLTTTDNPFSPFTQFDQWNRYDIDKGYHTTAYLARIVTTSNELSERDQAQAIDMAIDEILEFNLTGNYKKVVQEDYQ